MKKVVESKLKGDVRENLRFVLWCCRALLEKERLHPIASHMLCPWFMDDSVKEEQNEGIAWEWVWDEDVPHYFFEDHGWSTGMTLGREKCENDGISVRVLSLKEYSPAHYFAFETGVWPPHTEHFEVA